MKQFIYLGYFFIVLIPVFMAVFAWEYIQNNSNPVEAVETEISE